MTEKKTIGAGIISPGWMDRLHARACRALEEKFPVTAADVRLPHAAMAGRDLPYFSRVQPGAGGSMGFDTMKAVEVATFISGVLDPQQYSPSAAHSWSAAEIDDAVVASSTDHGWHEVRPVTGPTTYDK